LTYRQIHEENDLGENEMTVELSMLYWAALLALVQMLIAVSAATLQVGLVPLLGNREGLPERTGFAWRSDRAHRNMVENLVVFAALVAVVQLAGLNNELTALGAQIFFFARLLFAVVFLIGIPYARTVIFLVSAVGLVMVASPIFTT